MKLITYRISSCTDCPFVRRDNDNGGYVLRCGKTLDLVYKENDGAEIGNMDVIPQSCPLSDATPNNIEGAVDA